MKNKKNDNVHAGAPTMVYTMLAFELNLPKKAN